MKKLKKIEILKKYYDLLIQNDNINCVFCHSKAGYGKTYHTIKYFKKNNIEYAYNAGVTTAIELYKMLYENSEKVIILDDVENIMQDNRCINILKAATYSTTKTRIVNYKTSSRVLINYNNEFIFNGNIVILANNSFDKKDLSYNALLSRTLKYELKFNCDELLEMSLFILTKKLKNKEITIENNMFILNNLSEILNKNFNFRLLNRFVEFVKFDSKNALELYNNSIKSEIKYDDPLDIMDYIINKNLSVKDQYLEFKNLYDCSRATFFRFKQQYKKMKMEGFY